MTDRRLHAGPVSVVRVFVSRQAAEDRLPQHRDHRVPHVLPRAPIVQQILRNRRQFKQVVEFPLRRQPGIRGDLRTVEPACLPAGSSLIDPSTLTGRASMLASPIASLPSAVLGV